MKISALRDFFPIATLCSKRWAAFTTFVPVKRYVHLFLSLSLSLSLSLFLSEKEIERGSKKGKLEIFRRNFVKERRFTVIEMWEREWWRLYQATSNVREHVREKLPHRRSLTDNQLL